MKKIEIICIACVFGLVALQGAIVDTLAKVIA